MEAEQHAAAQGVDAADHGRVHQPEAQQTLGHREHLGARRAGRRHREARAFEAEHVLHEGTDRMWRVHFAAVHVRREPAGRVELGVGVFGRADARCGRAHHHRDARRTEAPACVSRGVDEAVGAQAAPGKAVVAAVPAGDRCGQGRIEPVDLADPGGQRMAAEGIRPQAAAVLGHGRQHGCLAGAKRGRGGVGSDLNGGDSRQHGGPAKRRIIEIRSVAINWRHGN